jgi:CheY-like chemotaxis protein
MMGKNCCTSWTTHDEEDLQKAFMIMIARSKEDVRKQIRKIEDRFDILCTETDDEAIQYISQYRDKISLVVAELDTGSNTGTFAPRYIKTRERFKDIPVLIIVEKPEEKESAYKLGANAVLCKNESPQEFKGIMSELAKV